MTTKPLSIVDQFVAYVGESRHALAAVVVVLLTLLLAVVALLQGGLAVMGPRGLWQLGLEPTLIVYILGIYPWLQRRSVLAIDALRPLSSSPRLAGEVDAVDRRGEWVALLIHEGIQRTQRRARLLRDGLQLDLFDRQLPRRSSVKWRSLINTACGPAAS